MDHFLFLVKLVGVPFWNPWIILWKIGRNWIHSAKSYRLIFLKPQTRCCKWKILEKANCMGWIICDLITGSESREFTVLRANDELSTLHSFLLDSQQTGIQRPDCLAEKQVSKKQLFWAVVIILNFLHNNKFLLRALYISWCWALIFGATRIYNW